MNDGQGTGQGPVMVVHGPEAFDQGDVARLVPLLRPRRIIVAGVMGRTAAEESGLPVEFDARPPSRVIADLEPSAFLFNRGKTPHSGRVFGGIVASRLGSRGLIHAECSSGTIYCWNGGDPVLAERLAGVTGFSVETAAGAEPPVEGTRRIRGCMPGEPVYVNGTVIGRATADMVVLRESGGRIEAVSGLDVKPHGLEKLHRNTVTGISTAWCKSGAVRSAPAKDGGRAPRRGRVAVIDHCGHTIYAALGPGCCGVLAIGDDTTAVCGHVCLHRGVPVLGVTDHDRDTILPSAFAPGSVIIDTRPERDDDVGIVLACMVPDQPVDWDDWVQGVLDTLGTRVTITLDLREARP